MDGARLADEAFPGKAPPPPIVTLLTDFGLTDPFVGIMKGVVLGLAPTATIVDLTHGIRPQAVPEAAFWLARSVGWFPPGAVHVVVVDPTVGTNRRVLAVRAPVGQGGGAATFIGPDNGVLTPVLGSAEVRAVDVVGAGLAIRGTTFHGRDVFAPLGAMVAAVPDRFTTLGPIIEDPVRLIETDAQPRIVTVDHFGNLLTAVPTAALEGVRAVHVGGVEAPLHDRYADVEPGTLLALVNAHGLLEVAVRDGSAAERLGAGPGSPVLLVKR